MGFSSRSIHAVLKFLILDLYTSMTFFKKTALPVLLATLWISVSEFVRNEFFLKQYWTEHYSAMGLEFPASPVNGMMWGVWSLLLAILMYLLLTKFSLLQSIAISWLAGFLMMWVVIGNLNVLPFGILPIATPLSLLEAFLGCYIIHTLRKS